MKRSKYVVGENRRVKQLLADLTLDKHILSVVRACALADVSRAGWYQRSTAHSYMTSRRYQLQSRG